jgi:hypothetical protein
MSLRIDTSEWISGALVIGGTGLGVLAENVPSTGTSGPAYAYESLTLPADNGKEICGRITVWPVSGVLTATEATDFLYVPAGDGATSFTWQLYVDGVATGSPVVMPLTVGAASASFAASVTTEGCAVVASASVSPVFSAALVADDVAVVASAGSGATFSGAVLLDDVLIVASASVAASGVSFSAAITTEDVFVAAMASVSPVALMAMVTDGVVVSGGAAGYSNYVAGAAAGGKRSPRIQSGTRAAR